MVPAVRFLAIGLVGSGAVFLAGALGADGGAVKKETVLSQGKELFTREWLPGDSRSHKGDGLGPLFNGRSCAACHFLGGNGGGGPNNTNVTIVNAVLVVSGPPKSKTDRTPRQPDRATLAELQPALRTANSFTLHRFGTDKSFEMWRNSLVLQNTEVNPRENLSTSATGTVQPHQPVVFLRKVGDWGIQFRAAERNTPPLFGSGLVDQIPEKVLVETAAAQARAAKQNAKGTEVMAVAGRVARLKDGRVGRFGWKAQVATLREFTLQACANEIGLEVPGFAQPAAPWKPGYKAPGLDMTADECDSLIAYVASLDAPRQRRPETEQHKKGIDAGRTVFASIGCAACHQPRLGGVDGIFSDLLLHDMGPGLSDDGDYGVSPGEGSSDGIEPLPTVTLGAAVDGGGQEVTPELSRSIGKAKTPKLGAGPQEWRTPPLWGLRDSAPYMHNGTAASIREAIALHDGEGKGAANSFAALKWEQKEQLEQFLMSLSAPDNQ